MILNYSMLNNMMIWWNPSFMIMLISPVNNIKINEYKKYENTDSCGGDIKHQDCYDDQGKIRPCTIDELKEACNEYFDCSGFNSNGWHVDSFWNIDGFGMYIYTP